MELKLTFDKVTKEFYVYLYDGAKFTQKLYFPKAEIGDKPPSLLVFKAETAEIKPLRQA